MSDSYEGWLASFALEVESKKCVHLITIWMPRRVCSVASRFLSACAFYVLFGVRVEGLIIFTKVLLNPDLDLQELDAVLNVLDVLVLIHEDDSEMLVFFADPDDLGRDVSMRSINSTELQLWPN